MKKALLLASPASMIYQFNIDNIHILQELGYEIDVAANFESGSPETNRNVSEKKNFLKNIGVNIIQVPIPRKIFDIKSIIKSYKLTKKMCEENNYDIVHCHSPIGGVIARLGARKIRKRGAKIIYTAHGFHFYKGAPIVNWLIFYPIELLCSFLTDVIITINKEDYLRAKRRFKAKKIVYIPGVGIDTEKINSIKIDKIIERKKLGVPYNCKMLLSVGELSKRKNHEKIIRTLATISDKSIYYCIAGVGDKKNELRELSKKLGVDNQVKMLGFRTDIIKLCKIADIFCFPSLQEGLPVALMEAMAAGLPIVCSAIRGNVDLIEEGKG